VKARDFGFILSAYAKILGISERNTAGESVTTFASIFANSGEATVANVLKRLAGFPVDSVSLGNPSLGDIAGLISPLEELLRPAAKAGVVKDAQSVLAFLRERSSADLRSFLLKASEPAAAKGKARQPKTPIREELVQKYQQELEANLASQEGFAAVFNILESTDILSNAEIVAISKRFAGVSSRSKVNALKKIWGRHQSLMTQQAKARATGGRSAA